MTLRKTLIIAIAITAISCFSLYAAAPNVTYTAAGTFATPAVSGADTLKLAGEPFTVSITANAASVPFKSGPGWAAFDKLKLTGTVNSGLLGPTPVDIASGEASLILGISPPAGGNAGYDQITLEAPVKVVGISLTIDAKIIMPYGTITTALIHPFSAVSLAPGNTTVIYADSTASTTLAIQSGSLTATIPAGETSRASVGAFFTEPLTQLAVALKPSEQRFWL